MGAILHWPYLYQKLVHLILERKRGGSFHTGLIFLICHRNPEGGRGGLIVHWSYLSQKLCLSLGS